MSKAISYDKRESGQQVTQTLSVISNKPATLADVVKEDYPKSIIRATQEGSIEKLVVHIVGLISDYVEAANISTMNDKQILIAAQLIVEKHPHLPVKLLDVFFKECLAGSFGTHYNHMDIPTLMQWLRKFENDYFDMVEEQAYAEHQSTKGDKGIDLRAIIESHKDGDDEPVPMPESIEKAFHLKREATLADEIRARVIKENHHLFNTMEFDEVQKHITNLINDELVKNGIFNLD